VAGFRSLESILIEKNIALEHIVPIFSKLLSRVIALHRQGFAHGNISLKTVSLNGATTVKLEAPESSSTQKSLDTDKLADIRALGDLIGELATSRNRVTHVSNGVILGEAAVTTQVPLWLNVLIRQMKVGNDFSLEDAQAAIAKNGLDPKDSLKVLTGVETQSANAWNKNIGTAKRFKIKKAKIYTSKKKRKILLGVMDYSSRCLAVLLTFVLIPCLFMAVLSEQSTLFKIIQLLPFFASLSALTLLPFFMYHFVKSGAAKAYRQWLRGFLVLIIWMQTFYIGQVLYLDSHSIKESKKTGISNATWQAATSLSAEVIVHAALLSPVANDIRLTNVFNSPNLARQGGGKPVGYVSFYIFMAGLCSILLFYTTHKLSNDELFMVGIKIVAVLLFEVVIVLFFEGTFWNVPSTQTISIGLTSFVIRYSALLCGLVNSVVLWNMLIAQRQLQEARQMPLHYKHN
jgi:hypothetical protein